MGIGIRPYRSGDAQSIIRWCADEESFYKWSAGVLGEYPITLERFEESTSGRVDSRKYFPFVMFDGDEVIGFFIMRHPGESLEEARIGFVIVDPSRREQGLGKKMLKLGLKFAFEVYGATTATLGVFDNNPSALHCYESVGFVEYARESFEVNGNMWNCIEMKLEKANG
ncbi:MAG: GNAT family N-acetyltransferase [Saccharofermentans sp.]|nr:GNAT family N-acetyltransferase [Saccharofermentans sp.]